MLGLLATIVLTLKAVKAAQMSVEVAQDTAKRQLRAYLGVQHMDLKLAEENKPVFQAFVVNQGSTPAYNVKVSSELLAIRGDPDRAPVRFIDGFTTMGAISSGSQRVHSAFDQPWDEEFLRKVKAGEITIVFAGLFVYRDAFKRRRMTCFKYWLRPGDIGEGGLGDKVIRLRLANRGNHAN